MKQRANMIRLSLQTLVLGALLGGSANSFAISEYLEQRGAEQVIKDFEMLLIAAGSFLALSIVLFSLLYVARRKLKKNVKQHQYALNTLPCGIVHLNQSGNIVYFNELAAIQLGRQADKLLNQPFITNFDKSQTEAIENGLNKKGRMVLARTLSSNLYLEIQTGETINDTATTYTVVTLSNQNTIKRQFDKTSAQKHRLTHLIENSQQGQVHIDTTRDTYVYDDIFANLLGIEKLDSDDKKASPMSVSEFAKRIHNHDIERWTSALDEASKNLNAKFSVRMQTSESEDSARYIPVEIYIVATGTDSIDSTEVDSESEHDIKYTKFSLLVRSDDEMESQKRKIDLYKHQHEAMLNASPHAIYSIDQEGKLLWSNTRFHKLMKRLQPDADFTNLLQLKPFPDDVMQLHRNVPFISTQTYEAEFELMSDEGRAISLKLDLAYYADKDRLSDEQNIGIVGILQDISDITQTRKELRQERGRVANTSKDLKLEQERVASMNKALMREQEQLALTTKDLQLEQERYAQASRELSQEQERMKKLLALSPVAIATIDSDDQIINANAVMLQRLKYSEKELRKGNIYKLFSDPSDAGAAARTLNKTGRLRDLHVKLKGKDGNIYPGELKVDLFNEEKQEYLFWIVDRADEQFQRDKFEGVLQGSTLPMAILSENGFTRLNQSACRFLGADDEDDLIGLTPYAHELNSNEETAQELEQIITDVKRSGEIKSFFWTHNIQQQPSPCHVTFMPIYKDHDFDCIICIWNDQSELKKTDEARIAAINLQHDAELKIAENEKLLANKQAEIAAHTEQNTRLEQTLNSMQEDLSHAKTEFSNLQQSHEKASSELMQLKDEYAQTKEVLTNSQEHNEDLNLQLQASNAELAALEEKQQDLANTLKESEQHYEDAQQAIRIKTDELEALAGQKQMQSQQMQELTEQINEFKTLLGAKDEQLLSVSQQIELLQNELLSATEARAELETSFAEQLQARERSEEEKHALEQSYQHAQTELSDAASQNLQQEIEAKDRELAEAKQALEDAKIRAEQDRKARIENEQEVEQLNFVLAELRSALDHKSTELEQTETKLMTAKVAESGARQTLEQKRLEANELQQLIQAKEKEEERLRQALFDQEQSLELPDSSIIEQAMEKQNALNEELTEMQQSYASKESSLHEQELASAQESLASSTVKIEEQERGLLDAQSQDFNLDEQASIEHIRPDIEKLPMPSDPQLWFDLVPFLQSASHDAPLPLTLSNLLDELEQSIHKTEALLEQDDLEGIEKMSKTLLTLAEKVHSDALIQLMQSIANDCSNGMADNVSIRWPATKQGIQRTVRVVYSHMH